MSNGIQHAAAVVSNCWHALSHFAFALLGRTVKLHLRRLPQGKEEIWNSTEAKAFTSGSYPQYGWVLMEESPFDSFSLNSTRARAKGDGPKATEPNLQFPAVFCENLRFSAVSCALQMLEFPGEG